MGILSIDNSLLCMKITNSFLILVLIAGTLLTYGNILDNEFVNLDDYKYLYRNPSIRAPTLNNLKQIFSQDYLSLYLPMTMLSYMLDYQLWELDPSGYHVTNLILHILNAILAFLLLNLLLKDRIASFMCAFIFALHPVQVESVAWVSERKNLLSSLFFFLSFISYLKYKDRKKISLYLFSVVLFLLALLSKPSVVVLPLLLIAYDYFHSSGPGKVRLKNKIPFFVLSLVFCIITLYFYKGTLAGTGYYGGSFSANFLTMISVFLDYLRLIFYPLNLSAIYTPNICKSIFHPKVITSIILLALLLVYLYFTIKRKHPSGFWILWFFIIMLPVMNLIPIPTIYNDRYLYLPILSFPALFYLILSPLILRKKVLKSAAVLIFSFVVIWCGRLSYQGSKIWHDSLTLWSNAVKKSPTSVKAHIYLASAYGDKRLFDKAIEEYRKVLASYDNLASAHDGLGVTYARMGLLDEARREWEIALELDPELAYVRKRLEWLERIVEEQK